MLGGMQFTVFKARQYLLFKGFSETGLVIVGFVLWLLFWSWGVFGL
jgi:hypothetical protein